jgi:hypothetical protein
VDGDAEAGDGVPLVPAAEQPVGEDAPPGDGGEVEVAARVLGDEAGVVGGEGVGVEEAGVAGGLKGGEESGEGVGVFGAEAAEGEGFLHTACPFGPEAEGE